MIRRSDAVLRPPTTTLFVRYRVSYMYDAWLVPWSRAWWRDLWMRVEAGVFRALVYDVCVWTPPHGGEWRAGALIGTARYDALVTERIAAERAWGWR